MSTTQQAPPPRHRWWIWAVPVTGALAGLLFVSSALSSGGSDLRPGNADLDDLVRDRAEAVAEVRSTNEDLREQIRELSETVGSRGTRRARRQAEQLSAPAGYTPAAGEGIRITLTDAPRTSDDEGVDLNLLVVHQQDLQAFVNALWAGGADAVSLQGQRLLSTTGIKCVGNTVVLDGVPYAPPYVIEAVGDQSEFAAALTESDSIDVYREYVDAYDLGLEVEYPESVRVPAYEGLPTLRNAVPLE